MFDPGDIDYDIRVVLDPLHRHEYPRSQTHLATASHHRARPRSNSSETIRPVRKDAPSSPPITLSPEPDRPAATPVQPIPSHHRRLRSSQLHRLKSSRYIHDGEIDLNAAYDYKFISLSDLLAHTIFREIQMELTFSARLMGQADLLARRRRGADDKLIPRHVASLPHVPSVHGSKRESYVALLALIALKSGIEIISVDQLRQWPGQTEMYQELALLLEKDMRAAYDESTRRAYSISRSKTY
ncbi:hypothetical protein H0H87_007797 [Tephrocybe sp. NHM501043]|nr:hypothetical protein H0H87_007797 [Tephrocybe sp. NHM501043]